MSRPYLELKRENEQSLLCEIRSQKTELTAFPPRCTLEISWRCNYNCKKCAYSSLERGADFSAAELPEWDWDDIERIAEEYFPTARLTQSTLLGEPFLSPQFKRLMELYRRYGVYYRPTTNGSLLTEDKLEAISGVVDWLKCSLDGHTEELYAKLHLNKNCHTVVRNLKRFSEAERHMRTYPWFRVGTIPMRSNLAYLKDYADFVFQELDVDELEIMAQNSASENMRDEPYGDLADGVNRIIDELVEHCIGKKYRLRLPFARMPRQDGTWDGPDGRERAQEIADTQADADNSGYEAHSEEIRAVDIFGNRQTLEKGYMLSNEMRVTQIAGDDGRLEGICPALNRPFFKPRTVECDGQPWIKVESCGSCSAHVFGNLKERSFTDTYNSRMYQQVRAFLYRRYDLPRNEWMIPCRNCLCVDPIYRYESNGIPNVGLRFFPDDDLYRNPRFAKPGYNLFKEAWNHFCEKGLVSTVKTTYHFVKDHCHARRP